MNTASLFHSPSSILHVDERCQQIFLVTQEFIDICFQIIMELGTIRIFSKVRLPMSRQEPNRELHVLGFEMHGSRCAVDGCTNAAVGGGVTCAVAR